MSLFKGSGVALVTPFKDNEVDYDKIKELINWHIKNDTDAIIVCGTTGESSTMSEDEKKNVIKYAVEVANKRIPIIAGSGSNNTKQAVKLSKYCENVGADGLLVVTPYYNKGNEKGLINHYKAIAESVSLPIILYSVPSRTGVNLKPKMVKILSEVKNIVALKDATGDISQALEIRRICKEDFDIYSGNDDMIVPILSLGGAGVISVVANILPKQTHDLVAMYHKGEIEKSLEIQLEMNALVSALFIEVNPVPVKTAMKILKMDTGELRLPLDQMNKENIEVLKKEMKEYGLDIGE